MAWVDLQSALGMAGFLLSMTFLLAIIFL